MIAGGALEDPADTRWQIGHGAVPCDWNRLTGGDHRTGLITVLWVGNGRKNSYLFLQLLRRLAETFPDAAKLHVILDNYGIHSSRVVQWALTEEFHGRIVLHFLPPDSPDHNRIERLWRELHANVTRNHRCATLPELLRRVTAFLRACRRTQARRRRCCEHQHGGQLVPP